MRVHKDTYKVYNGVNTCKKIDILSVKEINNIFIFFKIEKNFFFLNDN
jgi:hypothetical protein